MSHEETNTHGATHDHEVAREHVSDPVKKAADYRMILIVAGVLGALTLLEAVLASTGSATLMLIIAFIKAGLVVNFFMHISRLWRPEAH